MQHPTLADTEPVVTASVAEISLLAGERWWGGSSHHGVRMPYGVQPFALELAGDNFTNQTAPLLVSSAGRYVWSREPFAFALDEGVLRITGSAGLRLESAGRTLREAYLAAAERHFPAAGAMPAASLFTAPQFNTWIELLYDQSQAGVLAYARRLVKEGYPTGGVLMIDDGWQTAYGNWRFAADRFPAPAAMVDELHALGFAVMLWIVPYVSPDTVVFRKLRDRGALVRRPDGQPAIASWWNGFSAAVDLTGGEGRRWFEGELQRMRNEWRIDGFKFDGGDMNHYRADDVTFAPTDPNLQCETYARMGVQWECNEYRACWRMGGQPLAQRLCDKLHAWGENGVASLVPDMLALGLLGHPFGCADMIGGGEYASFTAQSGRLDQELFVRYAQASALMPMMQFSAAPWRVLDVEHAAHCLGAARLHAREAERILGLARHAARTGEPILRHLEYVFPHQGYADVQDQFMLGDEVLVAPVLTKGARERTVVLPPGRWLADDGAIYAGDTLITVDTPLARLPWFRRVA